MGVPDNERDGRLGKQDLLDSQSSLLVPRFADLPGDHTGGGLLKGRDSGFRSSERRLGGGSCERGAQMDANERMASARSQVFLKT